MTEAVDPVALAQRLIRCPSVTPAEAGALGVLEEVLDGLGFTCQRVTFSEPGTPDVENLYARLGTGAPHIGFAGHTDVVPAGDEAAWSVDPFAAAIVDDELIGRGVVDMKGAIASFVAAVAERGDAGAGSISLIITGDEEGPSINGTRKLLAWMAERDAIPEMCIVGEPTSGEVLGDTIKIGRRGSLSGTISVAGVQGHTAYPQQADNPAHRLVRALHRLINTPLDAGTEHFEPSRLQITSMDVGNPAFNVIPARAEARLNVRFNDQYDSGGLQRWIEEAVAREAEDWESDWLPASDSFLCPPGPLSDALAGAVAAVLGVTPVLGTGGGTSDARFIKDYCPVAELGLRNATAHKVDERAPVAEIRQLSEVYRAALDRLLQR